MLHYWNLKLHRSKVNWKRELLHALVFELTSIEIRWVLLLWEVVSSLRVAPTWLTLRTSIAINITIVYRLLVAYWGKSLLESIFRQIFLEVHNNQCNVIF